MSILNRKGRISEKFVFLLLFSLILGKSRKHYTFPLTQTKTVFFSKSKGRQKLKITDGRIFVLSGGTFHQSWQKNLGKSWQHRHGPINPPPLPLPQRPHLVESSRGPELMMALTTTWRGFSPDSRWMISKACFTILKRDKFYRYGRKDMRFDYSRAGDPDPEVSGPPRSGSISQKCGSGSFLFLIKVLSGLK
jgi:hypothetical protein